METYHIKKNEKNESYCGAFLGRKTEDLSKATCDECAIKYIKTNGYNSMKNKLKSGRF